tara:strand:+ start:146 stop:295 length:150 start_codon:yes stop_codon:yes gene_type:complete
MEVSSDWFFGLYQPSEIYQQQNIIFVTDSSDSLSYSGYPAQQAFMIDVV